MDTPELHRTQVDGVETIWSESPGPLAAGLVFRTGRVDETLATSGRTHLIEHLALWQFMNQPGATNGGVSAAHTSLVTAGEPEEVIRFMAGVSGALRSLPGERLEREKQVLVAEEATRHAQVLGSLLSTRYGVRGYGLLGVRELGFRNATLEQLQAWVQQRFCRENALLWLSGPPPAGLRLDLPSGQRVPIPPLLPVVEETPGWYLQDEMGGISAGAVVPRAPASSVFLAVCDKILRDRLRGECAISYSPSVSYEPLNALSAHVMLFADSDTDRRTELAEAFMEAFEGLGEFSESEVAAAKKELTDHWVGSLTPPLEVRAMGEILRAVRNWVCDREHETFEELYAEIMDVDVSGLEAFGQAVQQQALFAVPGMARISDSMGTEVTFAYKTAVTGKKTSPAEWPLYRDRLVYGSDGVSVIRPNKSHATVRFADLEGAIAYSDGGIVLVATDGSEVHVEPRLWQRGGTIASAIRSSVPAQLLLDQGPRKPEAIPRPMSTGWQRFRALLQYRSGLLIVAFIAFVVAAAAVAGSDVAKGGLGFVFILLLVWGIGVWRKL